MPLAKQTIDIPFGGLETKIDEKLVPLGKSLVLENAEFTKSGALTKRGGYFSMPTSNDAGGNITSGKSLLCCGSRLILDDGRGSLYEFMSQAQSWVTRSSAYLSGVIREKHVPANIGSQDSPGTQHTDVAYANGYVLYSYFNSGLGVQCTLVDIATGSPVFVSQQLGSSAAGRVAASGSTLYIVTNESTDINVYSIDTTAQTPSVSGPTALATDVGGAFTFDAMSADPASGQSGVYIAYSTATEIKVLNYEVGSGIVSGPTVLSETPANASGSTIGLVVTSSSVFIAYRRATGSNLRCAIYDAGLSSLTGPVTLESGSTLTYPVGCETTTSNHVIWIYDAAVTTGGSTYRHVRKAVVTSGGSVSGVGLIAMSCSVASRPFVYGRKILYLGHYMAAASGLSAIQATYLLLDAESAASSSAPASPLGRAMAGKAWWTTSAPPAHVHPSSVASVDSTTRLVAALGVEQQGQIVSNPFDMRLFPIPFSVELDFAAKATAADFAGGSLISGMQTWSLEGGIVTGNNFHVTPEIISTAQSASGGALSNGSYEVTAVFMRFDANGVLHESGTAVPVTVVLSGGTSTQFITVKVGGVHFDPTSYVVFYMTSAGGSVFYENDKAYTSLYDDAISINLSTDYPTHREIYTTGGVLDNGAPPSLASIVRRGKRVYGVTSAGEIWYTKEHIAGEAAAFVQETLVEQLLQDGGDDYALAEMDDNLIALGENSIQVVTGDGFDDTGTAGGLSEPRQIAIDAGRVAGTPIVRTGLGVVFDSPRGLYLLGRSLDTQYIGRSVDSFNTQTLASAVLVPGKSQIIFGHLNEDGALIYDYLEQSWSSFTPLPQVDAAFWQGLHVWLDSDGVVHEQGSGGIDDATAVTLAVETPWIKLANLAGFQRLYRTSIVGTWKSAHTLRLRVYYDYSQTASEDVTFDASAGYSVGDPLQIRHHSGKKCEAVKFRIEDQEQAGTYESLSLTGLSLELGGMGGVFRQGKSKTF